jgi:hypothetical protein
MRRSCSCSLSGRRTGREHGQEAGTKSVPRLSVLLLLLAVLYDYERCCLGTTGEGDRSIGLPSLSSVMLMLPVCFRGRAQAVDHRIIVSSAASHRNQRYGGWLHQSVLSVKVGKVLVSYLRMLFSFMIKLVRARRTCPKQRYHASRSLFN